MKEHPERSAACQWREDDLVLALNAAENYLQIAVGDREGSLLFGSTISAPSRGAEVLTPALESAFALLGRPVTDIADIAVVRGPGSFTGIRLAATTASALARTVSARQGGLDYMRCLARECLPFCKSVSEEALLWILVRARRDLVYAQPFFHGNGDPSVFHALAELMVLPLSGGEAVAHIRETAALHDAPRVLLAGSGAGENHDHLVESLGKSDLRVTFLDIVSPTPPALLAEAMLATYGEADIEPLYVRVSDAEANLAHIAARLGLDPDESLKKLHELTHAMPTPPSSPEDAPES